MYLSAEFHGEGARVLRMYLSAEFHGEGARVLHSTVHVSRTLGWTD
jgi:hypothetical protein